MKKTRLISIYFIVGCFYVCSNITLAYGDTYVSGNITTDTTWSKANSPYIVTETVQVLPGATLTIEPGVTVKFNIGTGLNVGHQLIAIGNEQERIIFTTNVQVPTPVLGDDLAPYCWHGIKFVDSALDAEFDANGNYLNGNIIKYCIIEYADPAIQIVGASPYIAFNKLQNNIANSGDWGGSAISIHLNPTPTTIIEYNEIENNFGLFGIIYCYQSSLKILNNKMSNNTSYGSGETAVISLSSCDCLIQNNEITNNPRRFNSQGYPIGNCHGIMVYMSSAEIEGNIVDNNGGYSLFIETNANVNAYWNELYSAEPFSQESVLINTTYPVNATLHYNNLKGIYIVGCPSDIDATNNYWGTTDTSIIDSNIFDYYDDITLGKVNYQPIRNEPFKTGDFVASPLSGSYPLEVFFTDNSMGIINSLTWDFGDGGTSNDQNPSHTYTSEGTFTVSLTINRPNGLETETKSAYITVNATAGVLSVTPADGLTSSGDQGGPFSPSNKDYTLQNTGGTSINWTASKGQAWTTLSSSSGTLDAGSSTTVTVSINSNANSLTSGYYNDTASFTNTTNSNGNTSRSVGLTVTVVPKPDLIETAVSNPPASAITGSSFSVTDTVKNQGNASAGASITSYYLSLDTAKGSGDIPLTGSRSVPSLGINGTNSGTITVTIPSGTASGSYYLLACADDTNVVPESNEGNNCITSASKVNVSVGAGISVISPNGGETWTTGTTQTIRWSYSGNPGSKVEIE